MDPKICKPKNLLSPKKILLILSSSWCEFLDLDYSKPFVFKETSQAINFYSLNSDKNKIKFIHLIRDPRDNFAAIKAGLKKTIKVDTSYFTDWIKCWLDYQAIPKNFFSKLPFGEVKNLLRKLLALEATFNQEIPMKIWRELGELNDDSRAILAEYIELLEELSEKQNRY